MPIDASVRCRCYENHQLNPGPYPYDDLYLTDEDYLWSRTLDSLAAETSEKNHAGKDDYEELCGAFLDWEDLQACPHPNMTLAGEELDWSDYARFEQILRASGEQGCDALLDLYPDMRPAPVPTTQAARALEELDRLTAANPVSDWFSLYDCTADAPVDDYNVALGLDVDMDTVVDADNGKARATMTVTKRDGTAWSSSHFTVVDRQSAFARANAASMATLTDLATGSALIVPGPFIRPCPQPIEFEVRCDSIPFSQDVAFAFAKRLCVLLQASAQTGNPLRWY